MELYILIGILAAFAGLYLILAYFHCPREQCSDAIKEIIMKKGLIHFTMVENAEHIQFEGLVPGKRKALFPQEKNFVWMYINDNDEFKTKLDIIHSKGDRKEYNAVVVFQGITENQVARMKYRKKDMAVIYDGNFVTGNISVYTLPNI